MTTDLPSVLTLSLASLAGLAMLVGGGLVGWRGWLDLQRATIARDGAPAPAPAPAPTVARIEIADLRERVRKLEAIAAGIDL